MILKHLKLRIGDMFRIEGRICRKTSILGFVYVDEAYLGEVQFSPDLDAKVEPITPEPPRPEPKTIFVAPVVSVGEVAQLRAHVAEAVTDPDYAIVTSHEVNWNDPITPMTRTLITSPGISVEEVAKLRAPADACITDPDLPLVTNYETTWKELPSDGGLLSVADAFEKTNSDIAIGLGISPEIMSEHEPGGKTTPKKAAVKKPKPKEAAKKAKKK